MNVVGLTTRWFPVKTRNFKETDGIDGTNKQVHLTIWKNLDNTAGMMIGEWQ